MKILNRLQTYSIEHDRLTLSSESRIENKYHGQKDSIEGAYLSYVKEIKYGKQRKEILDFLDNAIERDSLKYLQAGFHYVFLGRYLRPRIKELPTQLEYYKVVRYSLFELDRDRLIPPHEVPFLKHKDPTRPILHTIK